MKKRKVIELLVYLTLGLFLMFCYVDWNLSIILVSILISVLILIKAFEIIMFLIIKKKLLKLGRLELFRSEFLRGLIGIAFPIILLLLLKYSDFFEIEGNNFSTFFLRDTKQLVFYYTIVISLIFRYVVDDTAMFYATNKGLVTRGNYFESYFWSDFLEFKIIKEQSLIRFKKKNGKFLFITYDDTFKEKEELIIESLSKNLTEDVKNINH
ncbi:hypothetical protein [uncultured Tenacibaculum sp.]|uniref:hypothetical protein n=1 Tax=uncultured Tenacibaculum sp. TaxID=174713 RepID=UPI00263983B6|nr:hypothetical protein [uncultured Tenacibaculum sp.]